MEEASCWSLLLVLDVVVGRAAAMAMTGVLLATTGTLWVVVPLRLRRPSHSAAG